jgi:hypothetical protein
MEYPYTGRNLFEAPEHYFYAGAKAAGYLAAWRECRDTFCRALMNADAPPGPRPSSVAPAVSLEKLLSAAAGAPDEAETIEPYVRKYEVFKRLFAFYGPDGRRLSGSAPASLSTYVGFAEALLRLARAGSIKHLSTLLKLTDALTSVDPGSYSASEARHLRDVLSGERALVDSLEAAP